MSKIIFKGTSKEPDINTALDALRAAYESGNEERVSEALDNAKATIDEANRLARAAFYKSHLVADDVAMSRANIVKAGYIDQIKLINRYNAKTKIRDIRTDKSTTQIDVTEVNRLVRKEVFSDHILYFTKDLRDACVAYDAEELGKSSSDIESNVGYASVKYLSSSKTSITQMRKLLQEAIDEICFLDNGKGENSIVAMKSDVKAMLLWTPTKTARYGTKFSTSEQVLSMVEDIMWAKLNAYTLTVKVDDIEF